MKGRLPKIPDLPQCLDALIAQIPLGNVTTCGELAEALGNRIAARWVGYHTLHHQHAADCPCHRVVRAGGQLGQYMAGSALAKARRLKADGVEIRGETIDLDRFGFARFESDRPLEKLQAAQEELLGRISLRGRRRTPKLVGGVDVSYPRPDESIGAYALVEVETGRLVWSTTVRRRVVFPYITTYLAFRELPVLLDLLDEVRAAGRLGEPVLVDGSGVLHQRHAGVASHLGVLADVPTIGVTKKLLCGQVDVDGMAPEESRPVEHEGRTIGVAIRPTSRGRRPIFVSPGHRVNLAYSELVVRRLLCGRRLPEPLYWADRLSREAGR